jgi:L-ascorbate metabolism protein UlaG (beta-lactamase superfamily)
MKIMESYIQAPQVHAEAIKNPNMIGGAFVDLQGERVDQVQGLLEDTKKDCHAIVQLAIDLKQCDDLLQSEISGDSLEEFYKRIPESLKGLVELVYDLNNHPSIRLIEPLFYKKYYNNDGQNISLAIINNDYRAFLLSTPRFEDDNEIHLKIPFSDSKLDVLFRMRCEPKKYDEIVALFEFPVHKEQLFASLFTEIPPVLPEDRKYCGDDIRVRYFGHACILLETNEVSVLVDPIISYQYDTDIPRFTLTDLPETIDYVILTHNHQDHVVLETLLQLRHKIKHIVIPDNRKGFLADPSLKLILKHLGFMSLILLDEMETLSIPGGEIMGIPFLGEHADLNIQTKLSYYVNLKNRSFVFAVDSNNLENKLYEYLFDHLGAIDLIFIGMECEGAPLSWLYGPLFSKSPKRSIDNSRRLSGSNFEKAWHIVQQSKCKQAYVYAMGQEPWLNYIMPQVYTEKSLQIIESDRLLQSCSQNGIESERLYGKKEWIVRKGI